MACKLANLAITEDDWVAEIERLTHRDVEGFTSEELARTAGYSRRWARERIQAWITSGLIEFAGQRTGIRSDGRSTLLPVYRRVVS